MLAAADELADNGEEVTVANLAAQSGVSEVTIYRRWGTAVNVVLDAAVHDMGRANPIKPTGNLKRDLTKWARYVEQNLAAPRGQRVLEALMTVRAATDPTASVNALRYLRLRAENIQQAIDASEPPTTITVEDVLDKILAPICLRLLVGYKPTRTVAQLVSDLLASHPNTKHRTA